MERSGGTMEQSERTFHFRKIWKKKLKSIKGERGRGRKGLRRERDQQKEHTKGKGKEAEEKEKGREGE